MNTQLDPKIINSILCIIYLIFIVRESTQGLENIFQKHLLSYLLALVIVILVSAFTLLSQDNVNIPELSNVNISNSSPIQVILQKYILSRDSSFLLAIPLIGYLFLPLCSLSPFVLIILVPMMNFYAIFKFKLLDIIFSFGFSSIVACIVLLIGVGFGFTGLHSAIYYVYVVSSSIFSCGILIVMKVMVDNHIMFSRNLIILIIPVIKVIHLLLSYILPSRLLFISNGIFIASCLLFIQIKS